jgi:hypothetical protein
MSRRRRPTTTARGYGHRHQQRRAELAPLVATGLVSCARCGTRIMPGEPWDLGHRDGSGKRVYSGPEHRRCNRATERHGVEGDRNHDRKMRWSRAWEEPVPPGVLHGDALGATDQPV